MYTKNIKLTIPESIDFIGRTIDSIDSHIDNITLAVYQLIHEISPGNNDMIERYLTYARYGLPVAEFATIDKSILRKPERMPFLIQALETLRTSGVETATFQLYKISRTTDESLENLVEKLAAEEEKKQKLLAEELQRVQRDEEIFQKMHSPAAQAVYLDLRTWMKWRRLPGSTAWEEFINTIVMPDPTKTIPDKLALFFSKYGLKINYLIKLEELRPDHVSRVKILELFDSMQAAGHRIDSVTPEQFYEMLETLNGKSAEHPQDVEELD